MKIPLNLLTEHEFHGRFGTLESGAHEMAGSLIYKPLDRIELSLHETLPDQENGAPSLLGALRSGDSVVLRRCFRTEWSGVSEPGFGHERRIAQQAYFNFATTEPETELVELAQYRHRGLLQWYQRHPIRHQGTLAEGMTFSCAPPENIQLWNDDTQKVELVSDVTRSIHFYKHLTIEHDVYLAHEATHGVTVPQSRDTCDWIVKLLGLLYGQPMALESMTFHLHDAEVGDRPATIADTQVIDQRLLEPRFAGPGFIPLAKIKGDIESIVTRWMNRRQLIERSVILLVGDLRKQAPFVEQRFLNLIHALEAYCRTTQLQGEYVTPEDWPDFEKKIVSAIPTSLDSSHRQSLTNRIHYGNEYSLRKRLTILAKSLPGEVAQRVLPNGKAFLGDCVEVRNRITHPTSSGLPWSGSELNAATERLRILLIVRLILDVFDEGLHSIVVSALRDFDPFAYSLGRPLPPAVVETK